MSTVHVTTKIDAPVQRVWETIMDPHRLGEWVTIHRRIKEASSDPQKQGSTMEQVLHMRGVSFNVHWKLVEVSASEPGGVGGPRAGAFQGADPL